MKKSTARGRKRQSMSDTIRSAILKSGASLYRVSKDTGIPYATVHRFCAGRVVSSKVLDRLGSYLGLEIVPHKRERRGS